MNRLGALVPTFGVLLSLSGCAMTDDYFIEQQKNAAAGADSSSTMLGPGGMRPGPTPGCEPATEHCNGYDDDCDGSIDEQACDRAATATAGCSGFVVDPAARHGYMLCTGQPKTFADAQKTCGDQGMRLAWLESEHENTAVAAAIKKLTMSVDVMFGASDQAEEGRWVWAGDGGYQFWSGAQDGAPVDQAFDAWAPGTPNDANGGEDCVVMNPQTAVWGDRACSLSFQFVCEDLQ